MFTASDFLMLIVEIQYRGALTFQHSDFTADQDLA